MSGRVDLPPRSTVLIVAVLFTALGFWLGARSERGAAPSHGTWLASLKHDLALRDEQVVAIDQLLAQEDADLARLVADQRKQLREPVALRRQETEEAMLALLDDDQQATYERLTNP